ncbi:MAG: DMT family transporter [Burkholderiaceae bacterium]|nr:DMT family transporter [Burkholderiaceae bacterium]
MQLPELTSWAWIPVVICAAAAQTARNASQRSLIATVGTLAATLSRFLYGLPFAMLWLLFVWKFAAPQSHGPVFTLRYFAWLSFGALSQLAATGLLMLAMKERNFLVGTTLTKTEVLQVALFGAVFLHEVPGWISMLAIFVATVGVLMLSAPRAMVSLRGLWTDRTVWYGLASGAGFAMAAVGYRGASLEQAGMSFWLIGAWGVLLAQALQSSLVVGYLLLREPTRLIAIARAWKVSLVAGSTGALASFGWFTAVAMHSAAEVRTLALVEVLFSYLVSHRLMGERLALREKLGLGLMMLGLVVICLRF